MIIYENKSFEGLILSQIDEKYFIAETSMYHNTSYEYCLDSFELNSFLKRGDFKRNKIKNKNN